MQLIDMRSEVLAHGFDPVVYSSRINRYINNAYMEVIRRVQYYVDEATFDFTTAQGTASYPQPANFARDRSLRHTSIVQELTATSLTRIDSSAVATGTPLFYALDGRNLTMYPTPDNAYPMELRYWLVPTQLSADTDQPTIPDDYCNILIYAAIGECFGSDMDVQAAQYWEQLFQNGLAKFAADQKFPNADMNTQVVDMWSRGRGLSPGGWRIYGTGFE